MTDILLIIIAVLLGVCITLQVWQGKRAFDCYATTRNVRKVVVTDDTLDGLISKIIDEFWWSDYELVTIVRDEDGYHAFMQCREIKNYYGK